MKSTTQLFVLLPAVLAMTACGSVLGDARNSFKGGWVASSYDMAKAESWAPGKETKGVDGVKPAMLKACYVPGDVAKTGTGERCYLFHGDKLFSRTASYFRSGAEALKLFQDLAAALSADTFVFGDGLKTRRSKGLLCSVSMDAKGNRKPYTAGSTVFADTGSADAVKARDGGVLCGHADAKGNDHEWVRLEPSDGKYRVSYTQVTRDGAAIQAQIDYRKAFRARMDAQIKSLDKGLEELGKPE